MMGNAVTLDLYYHSEHFFFFSLPTANTGKSPPFEVYPDLILLQFCLKLKLEPNPLMLVYCR